MGQENIKTLLQCEKMALQIISDARKERAELKKKARSDAMLIINELKEERERELDELKRVNEEKLVKIEQETKEENREDMMRLEKVDYGDLVEVIANKIYEVKKSNK